MAETLPDDLDLLVRRVIERAKIKAIRSQRRGVSAAAERLSSQGHLSGPMRQARISAAVDCIKEFGREAINGVVDLLRSTHSDDPETVERAHGIIKSSMDGLVKGLISEANDGGPRAEMWLRSSEEALKQAAWDSTLDLDVAFAPLRRGIVRREREGSSMDRDKTIIYNVTGPNARVNVGSTDASTNIVNTDARQLFAAMQETTRSHPDLPDNLREPIRGSIVEMEAAVGTPSLGQKYANFMQNAANHVAVFQPFLQGLAQLLSS